MAELTFNSAGVSAREIDLTGPANVVPTGTPAGVIGSANAGPAFVPVTVATAQDFYTVFGLTDSEKFGPVAAVEWLRNAQALTYVRVLGAGKGESRNGSTGLVESAGFVVGDRQVQDNGQLGVNPHAVAAGDAGRLYFLGTFMSQSAGSAVFEDAGLSGDGQPVIRGVLMAASGVIPQLSALVSPLDTPDGVTAATDANLVAGALAGAFTGSVDVTDGAAGFVLLLNGHLGNNLAYPNFLTASFDPQAANYFPNVLNRDPELLEDAGHVLYTHYDIYNALAVVTASGVTGVDSVVSSGKTFDDVAFILPGAAARNTGDDDTPNYESFEDRFTTAFSPYVISQKFGADNKNLFRVMALSDGAISHQGRSEAIDRANNRFKISIQNVTKPLSDAEPYGTFDLLVRDFYDNDDEPIILEEFRGLNLNPSSDRYIARIIGNQRVFFDFDKSSDEQRLCVVGAFENRSAFIRVEMASDVDSGRLDSSALPVGFRGPHHLVTAGDTMLRSADIAPAALAGQIISGAVEPPVPYREHLLIGQGSQARVNRRLHWGAQFERKTDLDEPNASRLSDPTFESFTKFFPFNFTGWLSVSAGANAGVQDISGSILDSDRFNNNKFSLENIRVVTGSNGQVDLRTVDQWEYVRDGGITPDDSAKTRALSVETDFTLGALKSLNKFSFFVQGGFDGTRIFDPEKSALSDLAVRREMGDDNQGTIEGPTVKAFHKALEVMGNTSDVDVQLLAIPGMRHPIITDRAINTVENRFDALYIMDIEEMDTLNAVITSSAQLPNVQNTAVNFSGRGLDSSFAAAYYPDVRMPDPINKSIIEAPPSVAVLGAFSLNDRLGHPWFAPAGFTRGALSTVIEPAVNMNRANLDRLYEVDINPLTDFPTSDGVVVWGQKTLQAAQSSLDRINVRRLLIEIRRQVRRVGNLLLFEPNREETLSRFEALVNPILQRIQEQQGVERFRVIIDATTTTQADVENNTIRGKIFVQPTRVAEFVSLDFVVTNAGQEI